MGSGREDKGVHSTVNVQDQGDFGSLIYFPPENKGKLKWGVNTASGMIIPCATRGSIPNSPCPCRDAARQPTHRKHQRSPSCQHRLTLQELKNVPIKKKKILISCCCTSTLHQLSVIHTLLFEFRPYKWGNTLRVTCQVPPADDLWTDLL